MRKTHGLSHSPENQAWRDAKIRCYNPKYKKFKDYGGRGIRMSEEWRDDFSKFFQDMGRRPSPQHSLDRIDSNGNYEKKNCRWATQEEQFFNRRPSTSIQYFSDETFFSELQRRLDERNNVTRNEVFS